MSSPDPVPMGRHILGVGYLRTGTVEGSFIPQGDATLYIDGTAVATLDGVKAHPFLFGIAGGGVSVGRNLGQPVSTSYEAPFEFTGGTIKQVVADVSGAPYGDAEKHLEVAFGKD